MKIFKTIYLLFFLISFKSIAEENFDIQFNAYADTYIATDNDNQPKPWDTLVAGTNIRQLTLGNNIKNEFALNIAQLGANIKYSDNARGSIVIQAGNLPQNVYGSFSPTIQQAWAGVNIYENFWLDAGYFLSHIGGFSYLPKDNWFSSHSMLTFYEPMFQSGIKASYEDEQITASLNILNGSGIFEDNNDNKTFGIFLAYHSGDALTISYGGMYGNEEPGSPANSKLSLFHNFNICVYPTEELSLNVQFDYASKEKSVPDDEGLETDGFFTGFSGQMKYMFLEQFAFAVRLSYFDNEDKIITGRPGGFDGMGLTALIEYKPIEKSYLRLETRILKLNEGAENEGYPGRIFTDGEEKTNSRIELMLNFGVWLD